MVTITLTVQRTEAGSIEAESNTTVPVNPSTAATSIPEQNRNPSQVVPLSENENSEANERARQTTTYTSTRKRENHSVASTENAHPTQKENVNATYASLSKYVVFSDGDGKLRKVSKKMADFVNCKDGDDGCKQRLQQLRQKLAAKAMTTDFTGVLEMLRQLQ